MKLLIVLGFKNSNIEIDSIILPMQSLSAIRDPQYVMIVCMEYSEPISTKEATDHMVHILDAR